MDKIVWNQKKRNADAHNTLGYVYLGVYSARPLCLVKMNASEYRTIHLMFPFNSFFFFFFLLSLECIKAIFYDRSVNVCKAYITLCLLDSPLERWCLLRFWMFSFGFIMCDHNAAEFMWWWTIRWQSEVNLFSDEFDSYIIVSFVNATLVLSIGETVEEVTDSGFLGTTPTLSCSQLGDDALVQVHCYLSPIRPQTFRIEHRQYFSVK